jgi:hypothetical protein
MSSSSNAMGQDQQKAFDQNSSVGSVGSYGFNYVLFMSYS